MYLMLLTVHLKMAKLVNLLLWIFYHDNKKEGLVKKKKKLEDTEVSNKKELIR